MPGLQGNKGDNQVGELKRTTLKSGYRGQRTVTALVALAAVLGSGYAHGLDFQWGEVTGSLDTTVSAATSVRVQSRDDDNIGKANLHDPEALNQGGTGPGDPDWELWAYGPGTFNINADDGNLNYDKGDITDARFSVIHELELGWRNYGAFVRGSYFQDVVNKDFEEDDRTAALGGFDRARDQRVGARGTLYDAYAYGNFTVADRFLNVRVGQQALNWGESTFIQNGVSRVMPLDGAAAARPGSELREIFLPVPMVYAQMDLFGDVSAEAFYQLQWRRTIPPARGSFLSTTDVAGDGAQHITLGFGRQRDMQAPLTDFIGRDNPSDGGQFGGALRWFVPEWASTEFGLYAMNIHSRLPVPFFEAADPAGGTPFGRYGLTYPEDITTFGASLNTLLPNGVSMGVEVSYTLDEPLIIDGSEMAFAMLSPLEDAGFVNPGHFANQVLGDSTGDGRTADPGEILDGYRFKEVAQAQATFIYLWGASNPIGSDQWATVVEVGANQIFGMPSKDEFRFAAAGADMKGGDPTRNQEQGADVPNPISQPNSDFADDFGWGYRILNQLEYNNVFGAWTMFPTLFFSHDVHGTTPGPASNFIEGRMSAGLSFRFDYLSTWEAEIGYSTFFGGGNRNALRDRDFVSASVSYSF